jgi:hypothetical protein
MTRSSEWSTARVIRALGADQYTPAVMLCPAPVCRAALSYYEWDSAVVGAFQELLRHVERSVRGSMHNELAARFQREDWWADPRLRLNGFARQAVSTAQEKLARARIPVTPRAVVGRLAFGFWVSLLGRGADYETQLWRPALSRAFPGYRGPRVPVHDELDRLRELRNHLAHPGDVPVSTRDLQAARESVYRVLGWVSRDAAAWLRTVDRAPTILAAYPTACAGMCIRRSAGGGDR